MKLIGLVVAIFLLLLIFIWWIGKSFRITDDAMQVTQQVEQSSGGESIQGQNPLDYSKQKAEEFNQIQKDRATDINNLP